eukprot:688354-Rhodomonas_salina.2
MLSELGPRTVRFVLPIMEVEGPSQCMTVTVKHSVLAAAAAEPHCQAESLAPGSVTVTAGTAGGHDQNLDVDCSASKNQNRMAHQPKAVGSG